MSAGGLAPGGRGGPTSLLVAPLAPSPLARAPAWRLHQARLWLMEELPERVKVRLCTVDARCRVSLLTLCLSR